MAIQWSYDGLLFPDMPGLDPYAEWALGPGREFYFPKDGKPVWIPVFLRLAGIGPRAFADGSDFIPATDKPNWQHIVKVAPLFLERDEEGYCPVLVLEPFFKILESNTKLRERVPELRLSRALPADSLPPLPPTSP